MVRDRLSGHSLLTSEHAVAVASCEHVSAFVVALLTLSIHSVYHSIAGVTAHTLVIVLMSCDDFCGL